MFFIVGSLFFWTLPASICVLGIWRERPDAIIRPNSLENLHCQFSICSHKELSKTRQVHNREVQTAIFGQSILSTWSLIVIGSACQRGRWFARLMGSIPLEGYPKKKRNLAASLHKAMRLSRRRAESQWYRSAAWHFHCKNSQCRQNSYPLVPCCSITLCSQDVGQYSKHQSNTGKQARAEWCHRG